MLNKIDMLDRPEEEIMGMRILLEPDTVSGNDVLFIEHLTKSFDGEYLFQNIFHGYPPWRTGGADR